MIKRHKYTEKTLMSDFINEDISLLSTVCRFGITLGFGDKNIQETCLENGIDCNTFLVAVNFLAEGNFEIQETENISVQTLINYLKNGHSYFIDYKLPSIRLKLIDAVETTDKNIPYNVVFLKFFDEYFAEVRKHMAYEDETVFPYVLKLLQGKPAKNYRIAKFEEQHGDVESKLSEFKNIIIKYYPARVTNYMLWDVLTDILMCEKELNTHTVVEDYLFVPVISEIEQKLQIAQ
ncbi:MAG: hemerythrin domain-containing protein [Paludibacter sp.]|nr:hemerythrin domain-containing protein [Paludibacter sp.]